MRVAVVAGLLLIAGVPTAKAADFTMLDWQGFSGNQRSMVLDVSAIALGIPNDRTFKLRLATCLDAAAMPLRGQNKRESDAVNSALKLADVMKFCAAGLR